MTPAARISALFRHPIKGLGAEPLSRADLCAQAVMPGDREWALAQEGTPINRAAPEWMPCAAFVRGAKAPTLMAVTARREGGGRFRLSHPRVPDIVFDPATGAGEAALIRWVRPLFPPARPAPAALVRLPGGGMTDSRSRTLTLLSDDSLAALSGRIGRPLDRRRFRGNIWVSGVPPWQELDLIGQEITLGGLSARVIRPVDRCRAPNGNPETGEEDCDVLGCLNREFGHPNFGVFVEVLTGGALAVGDDFGIGPAA